MAFSSKHEVDYTTSNNVERTKPAIIFPQFYTNLLNAGESENERLAPAKALLDKLCDSFGIPHVKLIVTSDPRPRKVSTKGKSELHGFYRHAGLMPINITIYNTTAVKQQPVSIKRFADTLIHEFMHHYDTHVLKLGKSLHTAGFYKRISYLTDRLAGVERE